MQTLDKPFRELTQATFARYGFAYGDLLSQWAAIVGEPIARMCQPERITWPRQSGEARQRLGGTLTIRAAPGMALDLQHDSPRLIERINAFYGYGAITAIRIRQAASTPHKSSEKPVPALDPARAAVLDSELAAIADETLRAALRRLGIGALSRTENS